MSHPRDYAARMPESGRCRHADIFGKPGEGAHRARFLGVAAVDLAATALLAAVAARSLGGRFATPLGVLALLVVLLIVATVVHRAMCVDTALTIALLGPRSSQTGRATAT